MRYAALVSGGKDSIYAIRECQRLGHALVCCIHLAPPSHVEEESYMYQSAGSEVLQCLVEECLQVPLILHRRVGKSLNTSLVYDTTSAGDEVEDLFVAVQTAMQKFPEVEALCAGAILSTYQRTRIEHVCGRLGLQSLSYLWRRGTQQWLLEQMVASGLEAVLVRTAAPPGLVPHKHLGKTIAQLQSHLLKLFDAYQLHVCGEGGEYETLVLDCPGLFRKRLVLDVTEVVLDDANDDGVGVLVIERWHAEDKEPQAAGEHDGDESIATEASSTKAVSSPASSEVIPPPVSQPLSCYPYVCRKPNGVLHISELMATNRSRHADPAQATVEEFLAIARILEQTLTRHHCTPKDVCFVHLYLSNMAHFALLNEHYRQFFGVLLPPSRSCVGTRSTHRHVVMDALVVAGSGDYLRKPSVSENPYAQIASLMSTGRLRQVLHVQSLSHWAPVCVGPYSQANTLYGALNLLAGQIGLLPSTMKLANGWAPQLEQTWRNVANVLDSLGGCSLKSTLNGLVYVSHAIFFDTPGALDQLRSICRRNQATNAGIQPGAVDNIVSPSDDLDGYEDEETMLELGGNVAADDAPCCPLLVVAIPEMPVGALVEVELVTASQEASNYFHITMSGVSVPCSRAGAVLATTDAWDAGYDPAARQSSPLPDGNIRSYVQSLEQGFVACATVTLKLEDTSDRESTLEPRHVVAEMLSALSRNLKSMNSDLSLSDLLNVRLYHVASQKNDGKSDWVTIDDGNVLRKALAAELARASQDGQGPASTVVPVQGMYMIDSSTHVPSLAMQALLLDPVQLASDMWIHVGR